MGYTVSQRAKTLFATATAALALVVSPSCDQCSSLNTLPPKPTFFQLRNALGQDLWFGTLAKYDPDELKVFLETNGLQVPVEFEVEPGLAPQPHVAVTLFPEYAGEGQMAFVLETGDTLRFQYANYVLEENCEQYDVVAYVRQGEDRVCEDCGIPEEDGGGGLFVKLLR
ncbi:hypothetical protein GC167_08100 [bacterium]|nr:hypothetical protein [bacterium]